MGWFQGWKKIYLFYGVIFFFLGGVSGYLHQPGGWDELCRGRLQQLLADLRSYTSVAPDEAGSAVTVFAPSPAVTLRFYYSESWALQFPTALQRLRELLLGHFAQVAMLAVPSEEDVATRSAAAVVIKEPSQIIAGINPGQSKTAGGMSCLWWRAATVPPLQQLAHNLNFLPLAVQIKVTIQPGSDFRGEINWQETSQPANNLLQVMTIWAETMGTPGETGTSGNQLI